jgi:transposase
MAKRNGPAHVVTTTRRYRGKVYKTHLLRRSYREGGKVKNETLSNLSHLPDHIIELIRGSLGGKTYMEADSVFKVISSRLHGQVQAVLSAMKRLDMEHLIASRPCRERNLVMAMVAARVLRPASKLATTRWWHNTTLPQLLEVDDADEDDLYDAMDWLLKRQGRIEKKLAGRHLEEGGLVLYDLSSTYFEGKTCPLAAWGENRDGKKGKLQVNFGLIADERGCPVAVSVYEGNTGDSTTLLPQVEKVRDSFGIHEMVLVGDRGMISQKQIDKLKDIEDIYWITALRSKTIRKLMDNGAIQLDLFDERNLFEITHPDFPGERLVVCRNPQLAKLRTGTREDLLAATTRELEKVRSMVARGKLKEEDKIGVRVGKVVNKYKVAKHFVLDIQKGSFDFRVDQEKVAAEAALDGIYVIRTSLPEQRMDADDTVRSYKDLTGVERAFRSLKTIDLHVRPIGHRKEDRVRAHIFLCMLAYYVQWHMIEALRPLLFCDEDQEAKKTRDAVAPAKRSPQALKKIQSKTLDDGTVVESFRTLLEYLGTIVRNTCQTENAAEYEPTFEVITTPDSKQRRALDLIEAIEM